MRYLIILFVFISVSAFGQNIVAEKINSTVLGQERNIWIYTPWQYEKYPDKKLEVIYVFDAQAREYFDLVHSTVQFLGGAEFAFIVVGVESPFSEEKKQNRDKDFLPKPIDKETIRLYAEYTGGVDKFLSFLKTEVIPFMDRNYRTLPERIAIGHSNGGAFISYSLLTDPDLFNAYIAISPNYSYDKGQIVKRFERLKPEDLKTEKFIFISNANENSETAKRWTGWSETNKEVIGILKNKKFKSKIHVETKDFSTTENHSSTFPIGLFYGLKSFIEYQFRTAENVIDYYDRFANQNLIKLDPEFVNMLAYECFWNNWPKEAIAVINWAIKKFPNDHNLYDSQGEFYESLGKLDKAKKSFEHAIKMLSNSKMELSEKEYADKMEYYKINVERVSK